MKKKKLTKEQKLKRLLKYARLAKKWFKDNKNVIDELVRLKDVEPPPLEDDEPPPDEP
jgi:hypothetical protein